MNEVINLLKHHSTMRYLQANKQLPQEHLAEIIACSKQAATWMNGQKYSIIVVTDPNLKEKIGDLSLRNHHIKTCSAFLIFCADLTMMEKTCQLHHKKFDVADVPDVLITTTMDASLAMQNAVIAAESLGYGTVCCGGVRSMTEELIELFALPKYVYPLCGLSIGFIDEEHKKSVKPRLPEHVNVGYNRYPQNSVEDVKDYDQVIKTYRGKESSLPFWSETLANYYQNNLNYKTTELLKKQGF